VLHKRLRRLPSQEFGGGLVVLEARGLRARLFGLALLRSPPAGHALLIPRCASVHTFGMRFALDVFFLDGDGAVLRCVHGVRPGRVVRCAGAASVLEVPSPPRP
jgi:uncharacterized membrane protein (UPF0127 family)